MRNFLKQENLLILHLFWGEASPLSLNWDQGKQANTWNSLTVKLVVNNLYTYVAPIIV